MNDKMTCVEACEQNKCPNHCWGSAGRDCIYLPGHIKEMLNARRQQEANKTHPVG